MKAVLPDSKIPKKWYNILPDLPEPLAPPLDPRDGRADRAGEALQDFRWGGAGEAGNKHGEVHWNLERSQRALLQNRPPNTALSRHEP